MYVTSYNGNGNNPLLQDGGAFRREVSSEHSINAPLHGRGAVGTSILLSFPSPKFLTERKENWRSGGKRVGEGESSIIA